MKWNHTVTHGASVPPKGDTPAKRALGCAFDMLKFFGGLLGFVVLYIGGVFIAAQFASARGWSAAGAREFIEVHWWESLTIAAVLLAEEIGLIVVVPMVRYIITGERR